MTKRFWSYNGEDTDFHETEQQAREACEAALEDYRHAASEDGEWSDDVNYIAWGRVAEMAMETSRADHLETCTGDECDDDCAVPFGADYACDYELRPVVSDP